MAQVNNYKVIERTGLEHTIIDRGTSFQPIIVCWHLDEETMTWAQGHYFQDLEDARNWLARWYGDELPDLSVSTKLFKTRSLDEEDWNGNKIKYHWYKQYHTNRLGTWTRHIFTYDSTSTKDESYWDWSTDNDQEAQDWFNDYR